MPQAPAAAFKTADIYAQWARYFAPGVDTLVVTTPLSVEPKNHLLRRHLGNIAEIHDNTQNHVIMAGKKAVIFAPSASASGGVLLAELSGRVLTSETALSDHLPDVVVMHEIGHVATADACSSQKEWEFLADQAVLKMSERLKRPELARARVASLSLASFFGSYAPDYAHALSLLDRAASSPSKLTQEALAWFELRCCAYRLAEERGDLPEGAGALGAFAHTGKELVRDLLHREEPASCHDLEPFSLLNQAKFASLRLLPELARDTAPLSPLAKAAAKSVMMGLRALAPSAVPQARPQGLSCLPQTRLSAPSLRACQ